MPHRVAVPPSKRLLSALLKLAASAVLILVLFSRVDWESLSRALTSLSATWVAVGMLCAALTPWLSALRWRHCGNAIGLGFSVPFSLRATYSALFAGQFLPAGIGVDSARMAFLWRSGFSFSGSLASIALDRIAGVSAIVGLAIAGLPSSPVPLPAKGTWAICATIFVLVSAVTGLLNVDRVPLAGRGSPWVRHIAALAARARGALLSVHFLRALAYAGLIHLASIASIYFLAIAAGHVLPFWSLLTIVSVALFASLLPISFNGWGVREGALMFGLGALNVPGETALLISVVYGVLLLIIALPGSLAYKLEFSGAKRPT
jgi:uncharacterized membrane protein YbhN (UPF0104 family)